MKNNYKSTVIGIVLVLLIALGYVSFCRAVDRREAALPEDDGSHDGNITYNTTYADRGYIVYDKLPEAYDKLLESTVMVPTETDLWEVEYDHDDEDHVMSETLDGRISDYNMEVDSLKEMGSASFLLRESSNMVVSPRRTSIRRCINWDDKSGRFKETELFAAIESCGFSGFTGLISKVEKQIKEKFEDKEELYYSFEQYIVYCQKGIFVIEQTYMDENLFELYLVANKAYCYVPEKYKNMIDSVNADGDYFLYSSCVGGKRDVLVFCRDNTVCNMDEAEVAVKTDSSRNKRVAFVFEDGKLVDYYVVMASTELQLDETDRKLIDTYASGLGRTLSIHGEKGGFCEPWYLYRSK